MLFKALCGLGPARTQLALLCKRGTGPAQSGVQGRKSELVISPESPKSQGTLRFPFPFEDLSVHSGGGCEELGEELGGTQLPSLTPLYWPLKWKSHLHVSSSLRWGAMAGLEGLYKADFHDRWSRLS